MNFLIILLTGGLVMATAPATAQTTADEVPPAMTTPAPIIVPPLARMQTQISQALEILNTLRDISTTLEELGPASGQLITLLNDARPPAESIREVLHDQAALAAVSAGELTKLRMKVELLSEIVAGGAAPLVENLEAGGSPGRDAIDPNWRLTRDNIWYVQLPGTGVPGSVALGTAHSQAIVQLGERIVLDAQPIRLTSIKRQADGHAVLTFNFKDRVVTVIY